ncbi:MAG: hypothetical protein KAG95_01670 [Bacteroidales bacterium]|nr:hypothetical protein [Bacteroidales bacterium]
MLYKAGIFFFISMLIMIFTNSATAQSYNSIYLSETKINPADSNKVFFNFDNTNFIKNNEYFNKIVEGSTLIGLFANPKFTYFLCKDIKIEGGAHLLKYSGLDEFSQIIPIFTFQYQHKDLSLLLGTIYGTQNHNLPDPVFSYENYFTNNIENGMQVLLNKTYLKSDNWLSWEQLIFPSDTLQEKLTFGSSNMFFLSDTSNNVIITIPLQLLINHTGGQSVNINSNIQTLINSDFGFNIKYKVLSKSIKSIELNNYFITFYNNSPIIDTYFDKGSATYSQLIINTNNLISSVGYWHAKHFAAPLGNPMYQLVSQKNILDTKPEKQLLTSKIIYQTSLYKGIDFGFRTEFFYDIIAGRFDYALGLNIIVKQKFFLKKIKTYKPAGY